MKCNTCNTRVQYFQLLKSFWTGYADVKCEECGSTFKHKMTNRFLGGLIIGVSFLINHFILGIENILQFAIGVLLTVVLLSFISLPIMKFNRLK